MSLLVTETTRGLIGNGGKSEIERAREHALWAQASASAATKGALFGGTTRLVTALWESVNCIR